MSRMPSDPSHPYGNAGRNSLRDMTFNQFDLGLHKSFRLWNEHSSFDLARRGLQRAQQGELHGAELQP